MRLYVYKTENTIHLNADTTLGIGEIIILYFSFQCCQGVASRGPYQSHASTTLISVHTFG